MSEFRVRAGYGAVERKPMVEITVTVGPQRVTASMSPAAALSISDQLRGAAYSALADAAVIESIGGEKLTTDEVAKALELLRPAREKIDQQEGVLVR